MTHPVISPKKLIEVALPLDAINDASAKEKAIRQGHPSSLHLWWARRPLAAARAVIFSQFVHDPEDLWRCQNPGVEPNKQVRGHWTKSRAKLFAIIEDLVKWENTTNEEVLERARIEIQKSWQETCDLNRDHPQAAALFNAKKMPGLHDPFAGGGAIPLEAQRLGLEAFASDLNPVAVLINKAMIEVPPRFVDQSPMNGDWRRKSQEEKAANIWTGASGLAEDIRYYGYRMRDEAISRVGHLYPKVKVTKRDTAERPDLERYVGKELGVIAWIWGRTVKSPSPAFSDSDVPLANTFVLSSGANKEAYLEPLIDGGSYRFVVKTGTPPAAAKTGTKAARGSFRCLLSGAPITSEYIRREAQAGRMGQCLMAIVADGVRGRVYLDPTTGQSEIARSAVPEWKPEVEFFQQALGFRIGNYGMTKWSDLYSPRQLVALTTLCDLLQETRDVIYADAVASGMSDDSIGLESNGKGATAYAEAVSLYLAFAISKQADLGNTLCAWEPIAQCPRHLFGRQAIPIVWDFAEGNPLGESSGAWTVFVDGISKAFAGAFSNLPKSIIPGTVCQADACTQKISVGKAVSTDPPYYDNIGYADLSDFFYVWMRRSLREVFPTLLATITVPKQEELVATPIRHGDKKDAEQFFLNGMTLAMQRLAREAHQAIPITIYYAFKQAETKSDGTASTGWVTFLEAVFAAGLTLTGTWPVRTENSSRMRGMSSNALASSIVLVCRPRQASAGTISRRQFVRLLNEALPIALDAMTRESEGVHSPVAPVDLSQAIIGPGMAIFSRYDAVLEADGSPMAVKTALQLINRFLAEDDFDADTQFCLRWFEQYGWESGPFGEADVLARAKGTSVDGVKQAGVLSSSAGSVRLFKWKELEVDWDPTTDSRIPIWQVLHQLILAFDANGESAAAQLYAATISKAEAARQLAYRLYTLCERRNWAEDARAYNDVVTGWSGIESAAAKIPAAERQGTLFAGEDIR